MGSYDTQTSNFHIYLLYLRAVHNLFNLYQTILDKLKKVNHCIWSVKLNQWVIILYKYIGFAMAIHYRMHIVFVHFMILAIFPWTYYMFTQKIAERTLVWQKMRLEKLKLQLSSCVKVIFNLSKLHSCNTIIC